MHLKHIAPVVPSTEYFTPPPPTSQSCVSPEVNAHYTTRQGSFLCIGHSVLHSVAGETQTSCNLSPCFTICPSLHCSFTMYQLTMNRDQKLLSQLGFNDEQSLTVKSSGTGTPSGSSESSASASSSSSSAVFNSAYALEQVPAQTPLCPSYKYVHSGFHQLTLPTCLCVQEKSLPGVVMALVCNVFEMLYQLANLDESRYICTVLCTYLN